MGYSGLCGGDEGEASEIISEGIDFTEIPTFGSLSILPLFVDSKGNKGQDMEPALPSKAQISILK